MYKRRRWTPVKMMIHTQTPESWVDECWDRNLHFLKMKQKQQTLETGFFCPIFAKYLNIYQNKAKEDQKVPNPCWAGKGKPF